VVARCDAAPAKLGPHPHGMLGSRRSLSHGSCIQTNSPFLITERKWVLLGGRPRTVLGRLVARVLVSGWVHGSCPWSSLGVAGFLASTGGGSGLGAPMPGHIALVRSGRWRPSPDPVPEGAPSDRHARGVVSGGLWMGGQPAVSANAAHPISRCKQHRRR
jgi:hypothetical protein